MLLNKALQGFIVSLLADRKSPATVKTYSVYLNLLNAQLHDPDVSSITLQDLRRFFAWLSVEYVPSRFSGDTQPLKGASIDKARIAIKSFFHWACDEFSLTTNPATKLKQPEYESRAIVPFTEDETGRLLKACGKTREKIRNTAIVLTLLDTGLRAGELCRLQVNDVDLETGQVTVRPFRSSRKSKPRVVFLGKSARRAMWRHLASLDADAVNVFDKLTVNGLRQLTNRLGKIANVLGCHPHRFRHTFSLEFLRNGGNALELQRLLGHSTLDMTQKYVLLSQTDLQSAHKSASPVDRWGL